MVPGIYEQSAQSDHCLVAHGPDPCHHLRPFAADLKGRPKNISQNKSSLYIIDMIQMATRQTKT